MADIAAALTQLGIIESFLRSRYHYPHPIFQNLDALRDHLAEAEVPTVEAPPKEKVATKRTATKRRPLRKTSAVSTATQ